MYTYLLINIFTILIPLVFSFENRIGYARKWPALFPALFITGLLFLVWDHFFTAAGIWGFTGPYLMGISFFKLPLEEILFFVCIPYACLFIYEAVAITGKNMPVKVSRPMLLLVSAVLLVCAVIFRDKNYTALVCGLTTAFLLIHGLWIKADYYDTFHTAFVICLIPFLIVNGILTKGIPSIDTGPVVWYDRANILNLRVLTIPVEDFIYCYLLLFMNVTFYEHFKRKHQKCA